MTGGVLEFGHDTAALHIIAPEFALDQGGRFAAIGLGLKNTLNFRNPKLSLFLVALKIVFNALLRSIQAHSVTV